MPKTKKRGVTRKRRKVQRPKVKARCALTPKRPAKTARRSVATVDATAQAAGKRLRDARIAAGLSCKAVADLVKYDRQSLYRWEWGWVDPPMPVLRALARLYGTSVGWLANGEGDAPALEQSA